MTDQTPTNRSLKLSFSSLQVNSAIELRALAVRYLMISTKKVKPPCNSTSFLVYLYEGEIKVLSATSWIADCSGHIKPCNDVGGRLWAMTFWGNMRYCRWMAQRHWQRTNCAGMQHCPGPPRKGQLSVSRRNRSDPHAPIASLTKRNVASLAVGLTTYPWQPYHLTFLCLLH